MSLIFSSLRTTSPRVPPTHQKALYKLCVEHLSVLVSRAERAPFRSPLGQTALATAAVRATAVGEAPGLSTPPGYHLSNEARLSSLQPRDDPQDEPGNEKRPSPTRGLDFSLGLTAESQQGGDGDGFGTAGGRDGLNGGEVRGDAGERVGLGKTEQLQRQASSFDSHGAASVMSCMGGECHPGVGAFLLPEEEQVQPPFGRIHSAVPHTAFAYLVNTVQYKFPRCFAHAFLFFRKTLGTGFLPVAQQKLPANAQSIFLSRHPGRSPTCALCYLRIQLKGVTSWLQAGIFRGPLLKTWFRPPLPRSPTGTNVCIAVLVKQTGRADAVSGHAVVAKYSRGYRRRGRG